MKGATQTLDPIRYYAFLLDAFARYPREGIAIHPYWWRWRRSDRKPAKPLLRRAARMLRNASPGDVLEFGVWKGNTINLLAGLLPERELYGFDSFSGFPPDGRSDWKLDFALPRLPAVKSNVRLIAGYFEDTLPDFVKQRPHDRRVGLLHVDCDIYSSANTVFRHIGPYLDTETVIVFDELINYASFVENEFLALYEFLDARDLDFRWAIKVGSVIDFAHFCSTRDWDKGFAWFRRQGIYQNAAIRLAVDRGREARIDRYRAKAEKLLTLRPMAVPGGQPTDIQPA
ncbi:TylF/MycF/NovP-related O-methyltransferase [Zavarzinia aquatilis]|uniref:Class I SAM-dependent methyltransferase n=1 Tax=Zavarzinia aquatilis TaxID=2211142 RepID=A0A317E6M8_9PROT|nr:class I SAM-dependent methyltransferase [Zavarzinia aquatilis]PWR22687.1 hypothetical protein DKG74_12545 [Zavarzinia aquatilis]